MKRTLYSYFIASMLIASSAISYAGNNVYANACNEAKYLKCMNTNKSNCISSATTAIDACSELYPHVSKLNEKELNATSIAYAKCTSDKYLSYLGVDRDKFELCGVHLEAILNKYRSDAVNQYNAQ